MHTSRNGLFLVLAGLILTAAVYLPALGFGFVDDDHSQITDNPRIRDWHEAPAYFTTNVWAHLTATLGDVPPPYYRPLFLLWLLGNFQLFGLDPTGWHVMSILLHLIATGLAFYVLRAIMADVMAAAVGALLFGLHPVHVEAVNWISGAPELLMTIPFLAAFLCYIRGRIVTSVVLFGVALLGKETAIVLPLVLLVYERLTSADWRNRSVRLAPYLAVAGGYFWMRQVALGGTFASVVPWPVMMLTWPFVIWNYLQHLIWPFNLTIVSHVPYEEHFTFGVAAAAIGLGLAAAALFRLNGKDRLPALFALAILPPLYLRGITSGETTHDRYLYLPSLSLCALLALVISRIPRRVVRVSSVAVLACVAAFGVMYESRPWVSDVALFERALRVAPENSRAQRQLALALPGAGRCGDAIPLLDRLRQQREDPRLLLGLGACYYETDRLAESEPLLKRVLELSPGYQAPYLLLIGIKLRTGQLLEAEALWRQAVAIRPPQIGMPGLHLLGGQILMAKGDLSGAASEFRAELLLDPDSEETARRLADVERALGRRTR